MLPKKGRKIPIWSGVLEGRKTYARTLAELLRKEHGDSHRAVKQLMRQTGASERTVKNWLSSEHGPDALYFLRLVFTSPVIRAFFVGLIESPGLNSGQDSIDRHSLAAAREAYTAGEASFRPKAYHGEKSDPNRDPDPAPINDPKSTDLNKRQHWFLSRLAECMPCSVNDIIAVWNVSLKTARRDIRGLKQAQLVVYIGSRRKGMYQRIVR